MKQLKQLHTVAQTNAFRDGNREAEAQAGKQ